VRRAVCFSLILLVAFPAVAQDKAAAEAAFKQARRLLRQGRIAEACSGFEASLKLDLARGTQLNLASCYARLGRTASAWATFVEVAEKDTKPARVAEARKRAAELERRLARLTVTVVADPALRVTRDDNDITPVLGTATPVDPGKHRIVATWNGQEWSSEVTVAPARLSEVHVPRFWKEPPAPAPVPVAVSAPAEPQPEATAPPVAPAPMSRGKNRTWAWVTGGVGVAAIATGLVFGLVAKSRWNESEDLGCRDVNGQWVCPTQVAFDKAASARTPSTLSTVFVVAGGVALVGAGVLWFVAPERPAPVEVAPAVAPGQLGVVVNGRF
jgi:hypothetical protein